MGDAHGLDCNRLMRDLAGVDGMRNDSAVASGTSTWQLLRQQFREFVPFVRHVQVLCFEGRKDVIRRGWTPPPDATHRPPTQFPNWQMPPMQVRPSPQTTPHPPQFAGSTLVKTQMPLQSVRPPAHLVHLPPLQCGVVPPQTLPQAPQLLESF